MSVKQGKIVAMVFASAYGAAYAKASEREGCGVEAAARALYVANGAAQAIRVDMERNPNAVSRALGTKS